MIRASNLPVLLAIGLYERQRYRETSLMEQFGDFTERYLGSLPRRIKAAGERCRCSDRSSRLIAIQPDLIPLALSETSGLSSRSNEKWGHSTKAGRTMS